MPNLVPNLLIREYLIQRQMLDDDLERDARMFLKFVLEYRRFFEQLHTAWKADCPRDLLKKKHENALTV